MRSPGELTLFTNIDAFITALDVERAATVAVLERLTDGSLPVGFAPGLRTVGATAWHLPRSLVSISAQIDLHLDADVPEAAPPTAAAILEAYVRVAGSLRAAVASWTDDALLMVDDVYGTPWARGHTLRVMLDHEIHHRGQLTVLMRRAGLEPPPIYGPVATDLPDPFDVGPPPRPISLDPRIRAAWVLENLIWWAILTVGGVCAVWLWLPKTHSWSMPLRAALGVGSLFILVMSILWPSLSYRAWSYTIRAHDVMLNYGVLWRVRRSVPRPRIQHVDVKSGPLDRTFGVAKCTLYTAGTGEADATIPGVVPEDAEALRERLLEGEDYRGV